MKRFLALTLVMTSLSAYPQTDTHPDGDISGIVTDQSGTPVSAATVYAVPQDITFDGITPRSIKTGMNGEFRFRGGFKLGAYKLYSRKDADAYPDRSDSFYADPEIDAPKVDLTEDRPSAILTLTLGEKAGVLIGRVTDADTGAALKAKLVFTDDDGNSHSVWATGKYRALLPAGKDVTLMVMGMSPNYQPKVPTAPLRLTAGQEMRLDIPLSKQ